MKFIPNTNEQYKFDAKGNVWSLKRNRFLLCHYDTHHNCLMYSIIFNHGRRNISKESLINLYTSMNMELKRIPNCSNYGITNNGYVYSYITNCEVKMFYDKNGYARTSLVCDDGIRRKFRRNRLVALTYIPNNENKPIVNHKDGIKSNDYVDNLEWVTNRENIIHAIANNLIVINRDNLGRFKKSSNVQRLSRKGVRSSERKQVAS